MGNLKLSIFLTSFLILFLELVLIRFIPAQVSYLGYYSNFILLASFVGIGTGIMLANVKRNLLSFFPPFMLFLVAFWLFFQISILPGNEGEIHFSSTLQGLVIPEVFMIPLIFIQVTILFALVSQRLGVFLNKMNSLTAYFWDLAGSLSGIVVFVICSLLETGPVTWFTILTFFYIGLVRDDFKRKCEALICFGFAILLIFIYTLGAHWSPYQKVTTAPIERDGKIIGHSLFVNNIGHQSVMEDVRNKEAIYFVAYENLEDSKFNSALVIGAGTGSDVGIALSRGVESIDAVEIDPVILRLGKELHPSRPYQDKRVSLFVDDARSFLKKNDRKYDLIIFALPDSLMLASTHGSIRLESFLFTLEAFEEAKRHLSNNGLLVLYNSYRKPWLIEKLAGMLQTVFGEEPYVLSGGPPDYLATFMIGERVSKLKKDAPQSLTFQSFYKPAVDNWPFLYLDAPSIPTRYAAMIAAVVIFIYGLFSYLTKANLLKTIEPTYFFLGAGFLLLETKGIVQFSLLFGTTWIVNALVFFAILIFAFCSVIVAKSKVKIKKNFLYAGLIIGLILQYFFESQTLLGLAPIARYAAISVLIFTPIFFANLIFSYTFKDSKNNSANFASNILGAAFGGILEYLALLIGYRYLTIVILICYLLALQAPMIKRFFIRSRLSAS